jgi:hypothetical protein
MLAHFQHLNFYSLLKYFDVCHVLFLDLFYCYFHTCFQMSCHLHEAELTTAKSFFKFIVIKYAAVSHLLLKCVNPFTLFALCLKKEIFGFVWSYSNSDRIKGLLCCFTYDWLQTLSVIFYKTTCKTVHLFLIYFSFFFLKYVNFVTWKLKHKLTKLLILFALQVTLTI